MLNDYDPKNLKYDIPVGIIIALVSIPISMGYAQVAFLPPEYGLYGSVLPILMFGLISTSPRFVFGVDAAPAALVGGLLYSMGITAAGNESMAIVPVITIFTAIWLFVFAAIDAGKFVKFISTPVMEGFITGISCEIILMQIPKLFGGSSGIGEFFTLLANIYKEGKANFNGISLALGLGTIVIILVCKKVIPKIPMTVIMMGVGAFLTAYFHIDQYGVKLLPEVKPGLPMFIIPDFTVINGENFIPMAISSLSIALVIVSETLLATSNYAMKNDDKINNRKEILAYAVANLSSGICGVCPVNGSVSRTGIAAQFEVKSQVMSVVASVTMILVLMFGTGFIAYLPVPVLTGIVISALIGTLEFGLARKLKKVDKIEWMIFYAVFFAVLLLGTIYGVLTGVLLSFITVIIRASSPPVDFMGCIEGQDGFFPLGRMRNARNIEGVIIYQFKGPLFFANIGQLQDDIEEAVEDSKFNVEAIIIDARGIGSIDTTATERLIIMYNKYKKKGIRLFLTEHAGSINDQLRTFGAEILFDEGAIKRHIEGALEVMGKSKPYKLVVDRSWFKLRESAVSPEQTAEFEWAFGSDADEKMNELAAEMAEKIVKNNEFDEKTFKKMEREALGAEWSEVDENKFLDLLEMQLAILAERKAANVCLLPNIEERILQYHANLGKALSERTKDDLLKLIEIREKNEERLAKNHPDAYEHFKKEREKYWEQLEEEHPELVHRIDDAKMQLKESRVKRVSNKKLMPWITDTNKQNPDNSKQNGEK